MDCFLRLRKLGQSHHFGLTFNISVSLQEVRALAFAPKRRVVENGNGRLPGGTLVLFAAATP